MKRLNVWRLWRGICGKKNRIFAKNKTKELTHRSKVYFEDLGIRNVLLGKLGEEKILMDKKRWCLKTWLLKYWPKNGVGKTLSIGEQQIRQR